TAGAIESRPAQGFAIATAVTHAQPAVLPQFSGGAEATWRVNVSTEATSTDGSHSGRSAKELDLGKGLSRPQHQPPRFGLRLHRLIQHRIKLRDGRAQIARLYSGQYLFASRGREEPFASDIHSLHSQARLDLSFETRLLRRQLIVMLHQLFEVAPR